MVGICGDMGEDAPPPSTSLAVPLNGPPPGPPRPKLPSSATLFSLLLLAAAVTSTAKAVAAGSHCAAAAAAALPAHESTPWVHTGQRRDFVVGSAALGWFVLVRAPHNMDYNPTRWPESPRIVMR